MDDPGGVKVSQGLIFRYPSLQGVVILVFFGANGLTGDLMKKGLRLDEVYQLPESPFDRRPDEEGIETGRRTRPGIRPGV